MGLKNGNRGLLAVCFPVFSKHPNTCCEEQSISRRERARGSGEALRFGVNRYYANLFRPLINEAIMLLENVTFQGLNQCALHASVQKNVKDRKSVV